MRTYDDAFSGQKIYPGKVRSNTLYRNSDLGAMGERNLCGIQRQIYKSLCGQPREPTTPISLLETISHSRLLPAAHKELKYHKLDFC